MIPYKLMMAMDKIMDVERYQIIQETEKDIKINILQGKAVSDETISKAAKSYKNILDENIDIEVRIVKDMPIEKTGKFKTVVSNVQKEESIKK